jgi:hypothetical protein
MLGEQTTQGSAPNAKASPMKKRGHGRLGDPNRLLQQCLYPTSEEDSSCSDDDSEKNEVSIRHYAMHML